MLTPAIITTPQNPLMRVAAEIKQFGSLDLESQNNKVFRTFGAVIEFLWKAGLAIQWLAWSWPAPEGAAPRRQGLPAHGLGLCVLG